MARPSAALLLHVTGLWVDSVYSPEQPMLAVRLPQGGGDVTPFGAINTIRGQSYDPGAISRR